MKDKNSNLTIKIDVLDEEGKIIYSDDIKHNDYFYFKKTLDGKEAIFSEPRHQDVRNLFVKYKTERFFRITITDAVNQVQLIDDFSYWPPSSGFMQVRQCHQNGSEVIEERQMIILQNLSIEKESYYMIQKFSWSPINWIPTSTQIYNSSSDLKITDDLHKESGSDLNYQNN